MVLAYSGGLDTSIIIPWLRENYGCEVIAMVGNVGQGDDYAAVRKKALASGATKVFVEDLREEFVTGHLWKAVKAGTVYEGKYLLGTSLARPVLAKAQVKVALEQGADALAHGCTGKGNDQVRFELAYKALAPHLRVIAPWREWSIKSREDALQYAEAHGIPRARHQEGSLQPRPESVAPEPRGRTAGNQAGRAARGRLEAHLQSPKRAGGGRNGGHRFRGGRAGGGQRQAHGPVKLVETLNEIGGRYGVGRTDLVENRLVGMKSHGAYETPGGTLIYAAHQELEALCLDRETLHYKQHVALRYAELVYYGQWFTPLREALDSFVETTQRNVTGKVTLGLYRGNVRVLDRSRPIPSTTPASAAS